MKILIFDERGNKISRRQILQVALYTLGGAVSLGLTGSIVKNYLKDSSERPEEEVIVGRDEKGLHSQFRGDDLRVVVNDSAREGLDQVLYELNNKYNPNFPIKGDKLIRLRDLFEHLNQIPDIEKLEVGEVRKYRHKSQPINVLSKKQYYFPVYDLSNKLT